MHCKEKTKRQKIVIFTQTLQAWNFDVFGQGDNVLRARTIFALAWFHAVVQERRIFIPQGWCKFYEFSDSDLKAGLQVIELSYTISLSTKRAFKQKGCGLLGTLFYHLITHHFNHTKYITLDSSFTGQISSQYDSRVINCFLSP